MGPASPRGARLLVAAVCALLAATAMAACGRTDTVPRNTRLHLPPQRPASLVLDFTPNAIHSGIYAARAHDFLRRGGVDLHIQVPGASTDAVSLLVEHRVNFGILDIHDLALADAKGKDLVGIMAIVERPLASVIAQPRFSSPRSLAGQTVGVTGAPSDLAVLHSIVAGAGGRPSALKTLTIGYDAVPDLIAGRVAAATAFWNDEGVLLQRRRPGFHIFRVEDFGAPPYPELVLCAPASELRADPGLARAVVQGLQLGYRYVQDRPADAAHALESATTGLVPSDVSAQLRGELPAFSPVGGGPVGALEPAILGRWARWEQRFGIVRRLPDVRAMFTQRFLQP